MKTLNTAQKSETKAPRKITTTLANLRELREFLKATNGKVFLATESGQQALLSDTARKDLANLAPQGTPVAEHCTKQEWLTTTEAAEILGISRSTMVRLLDNNELPYKRIGEKGHRKVNRADVLTFSESQSGSWSILSHIMDEELEAEIRSGTITTPEIARDVIKETRKEIAEASKHAPASV